VRVPLLLGETGLEPRIGLQILSDHLMRDPSLPGPAGHERRRVWLPRPHADVKFDTGANSTYLHLSWIQELGLKDDGVVNPEPAGVDGSKIVCKKKLVQARVPGFDESFPLWINYSSEFRKGLFNIGLSVLTQYYTSVTTHDETLLFRNGRGRSARR
jgi:hypothetical protein